jgi:hypothetical protein
MKRVLHRQAFRIALALSAIASWAFVLEAGQRWR